MDQASGHVRLRATEPTMGASQAERFKKIFEPLPTWVDKSAKIVTDFSIDKENLVKLGYNNVSQCSLQAKKAEATNTKVMDYLKGVVPRMFQNNLSLINTNVIQQFLDELTFRECFGHLPLICFDTMLKKIGTQTTHSSAKNTNLLQRLKAISENPFYDWRMNLAGPRAVSKPGNVTPATKPAAKSSTVAPAKTFSKPGNVMPAKVVNKPGNVVPAKSPNKPSNSSPLKSDDKSSNKTPNKIINKQGSVTPAKASSPFKTTSPKPKEASSTPEKSEPASEDNDKKRALDLENDDEEPASKKVKASSDLTEGIEESKEE